MKEITVYTASYCSYCSAAKRLLDQLNISFKEVDLEGQEDLRRKLSAENNGYRTVPMIFIDKEFIGGFQELNALHKNGQLLTKLQ